MDKVKFRKRQSFGNRPPVIFHLFFDDAQNYQFIFVYKKRRVGFYGCVSLCVRVCVCVFVCVCVLCVLCSYKKKERENGKLVDR